MATKKPAAFKALLDRSLVTTCWQGALTTEGDWATDGKVMFSLCSVIGPYIKRAEALAKKKNGADRVRGQEEADRLMDAIEGMQTHAAEELGWRKEHVTVGKKHQQIDVMYVKQKGTSQARPLKADYVRLLKSFVDYDEVRVPTTVEQPVSFFKRGELVAICTPLALPVIEVA